MNDSCILVHCKTKEEAKEIYNNYYYASVYGNIDVIWATFKESLCFRLPKDSFCRKPSSYGYDSNINYSNWGFRSSIVSAKEFLEAKSGVFKNTIRQRKFYI